MPSLKDLYLVCIACLACFTWINLISRHQISRNNGFNKFTKINERTGLGLGLVGRWKKVSHKRLKYILVWPSAQLYPFSDIAPGQEQFIRLNCPVRNCFVTSNRTFFRDIRKFDVVVFMGKEITKEDLPDKRARYQKYIFFNMESSPNYPVDDKIFDSYFNWTATYRLDSDIPLPYLLIKDKDGNIVGPKRDMHWVPEVPVDDEVIAASIMRKKSRAAAIFYSNCRSLSEREAVIRELSKELIQFGLTVDVYGSCGPYKCPRMIGTNCSEILERGYFFYLSYENSFDIDYATEKLLTPLRSNVVPIVYGGANYSRFLPPKSYLDATDMSTWKLANTMVNLIASPKKYLQYFWWKKYYTYHDPIAKENICNFCATINNKKRLRRKKTYHKFRKWWNIYGYN